MLNIFKEKIKMNEIYKILDLNNLPNEIWLPICGYENYQVSNMGRIKSLGNDKTRKDRILRQVKNNKGYLYLNLCKEGKCKNFTVHRLVANAFLDNPSNLKCVNHKDENPLNNCVDNLEWCTYKYNNIYGSRLKKVSEKQRNDPNKSKQVYQYDKNGTLVAIYPSAAECQRNGYSAGNVSQCCRNCFNREGNNVYKNYIWSYEEINQK